MVQVHSGKRGKYNNAATGTFFPTHPEKYKGSKAPVYKSGLEMRCMMYLDKNPSIISWSYEPTSIKYLDKSQNPPKVRRYFIDFIAVAQVGPVKKIIWIEVKPSSETKAPKNKTNIKAQLTWLCNQSKWQAAKQLAESQGKVFYVLTEKELN